jgi:hypothetical protein
MDGELPPSVVQNRSGRPKAIPVAVDVTGSTSPTGRVFLGDVNDGAQFKAISMQEGFVHCVARLRPLILAATVSAFLDPS